MDQAPTFTSSNEANKWIAQGNTEFWSSKGYQIYYYYNYLFGTTKKSGNVFSPALQIPADVEVPINYSLGINCFASIHAADGTVDVYTGVTTSPSIVKTQTTSVSKGNYKENTITNIQGSYKAVTNTRISISHNEAALKSNRAENWVLLTYLNIDYAL